MLNVFEEKGKIYTQVVSKTPVRILLQTATNRIRGNMHVKKGERLKDELDAVIHFLAVTDADVFDSAGEKLLFKANFMAVNREQIIWVFPEEELDSVREAE
jgi:hypothetical protein